MNVEISELIAKHLSDTLSEEEERELSAWMRDRPENTRIFEEAQRIWNTSDSLRDEFIPQPGPAWHQLRKRMTSSAPRSRALDALKRHSWKVAAALLVILAATFTLRFLLPAEQAAPPEPIAQAPQPARNVELIGMTEVRTTDSVKMFYLPDSSHVMLNKNSMLSYAVNFSDTARILYLSGEAYFEVTTTGKPFVVYAGGTQIRVVGTAFNVRARDEDKEVEVTVDEGKVIFRETGAPETSMMLLGENDRVRFSKDTRITQREKTRGSELWWKKVDKEFKRFFKKLRKKKK